MSLMFPQQFDAIGSVSGSTVLFGDNGSVNGKIAISVIATYFNTLYATFAQGAKADTALQPAAIGVSVQAYSAILAGTQQSFTTTLKDKLDGIAENATANSADAYLLARANHTGEQAISTIDGLQSALDGKQTASAVLTTLASASANGQSLVTAANYAAMRTLLSVYTSSQVDSAISNAIANLLDSAPGALDTLNELAAALGDDPNFASTMTTALAGKQPLDSVLTDLTDASANGVALVQADNYAAMRALLDLEAGTDFYSMTGADAAFQAKDATLTALAGLTTAADKMIYATDSDTFGTADLTSVARTLLAQTTQALMRTAGLGMSSNGSALVAAADYAAMRALLDLEIGVDVQGYDVDTLKADTSDDLTAGFTATSSDQGTKSSGTFMPDFATRNVQHCVNNGAFTLGVPTGHGSLVLDIENDSSAGAIITSAFDLVTGDEFTTTDNDLFRCFITCGHAGSHLHVVAFQ